MTEKSATAFYFVLIMGMLGIAGGAALYGAGVPVPEEIIWGFFGLLMVAVVFFVIKMLIVMRTMGEGDRTSDG